MRFPHNEHGLRTDWHVPMGRNMYPRKAASVGAATFTAATAFANAGSSYALRCVRRRSVLVPWGDHLRPQARNHGSARQRPSTHISRDACDGHVASQASLLPADVCSSSATANMWLAAGTLARAILLQAVLLRGQRDELRVLVNVLSQ